jgi:hypothetical protein
MNIYVKSLDEDSVRAMQSLEKLVCAKSALEDQTQKNVGPTSLPKYLIFGGLKEW